jgi:hypothetical protein
VGHKPEPVALVRRSNVGSSQHRPPAVIPERGQITGHLPKSSNNERWAVLHEHESGSNLANDAGHFDPKSAARSVDPCARSGATDVLTGKAARNHVNTASPRSAVKGANVIPYRERREKAVVLSGDKNARGVGLPLDSTDRAPSEQVARENSSTSARE